jgi:hypothetical protein
VLQAYHNHEAIYPANQEQVFINHSLPYLQHHWHLAQASMFSSSSEAKSFYTLLCWLHWSSSESSAAPALQEWWWSSAAAALSLGPSAFCT